MLKNKTIGFLGAGNMAEAIIKGLVQSGELNAKKIIASDVVAERLAFLKNEYKINVTQDNKEVVGKSDIVILAVKPQTLKEACAEISKKLDAKKLVISLAAGVSIATLEGFMKGAGKISVIRTMPNTPAVVLEGATALTGGKHATQKDLEIAHQIFKAVGITVEVPENLIDAVTGLSGSGPAYVFTIIEAFSDAGVKMGLSRDIANALTIQTLLGSAKLAQETGLTMSELKSRVTSPGGTTISGIHALEAGGLRATLMDAVEESTLRAEELGKMAEGDSKKKKGE